MKSKSIIGAALAAIFTLGVTTSCEDMFDIDSSRVVIDKEHTLSSTADSAYTTLGVLKCMQEIADRYIILGEVRGDMVEINEHTKTSLRNLADFNYDADNEYLDIKDYYAADYMGMVATIFNSLAFKAVLDAVGVSNVVMSAININQVCEPYYYLK